MKSTLALASALLAASAVAAAAPPTVQIKNGTLQGVRSTTYNQDYFLGIPYAAPPVGDLRFARAQPYNATWYGPKAATAYGPSCVGYGGDQIGYSVSEDCLTLNVVRPAGVDPNEKLPVAFWIHGGGYVMGGSQDRRYNLSFIVDNGVQVGKPFIGVSVNYRLSAWGFLASKEVDAEGSTNLGLRDQRTALQWVQENIEAFGGDKTKVTIWGESAGGSSVGNHLIAYGGKDEKLFWAGVMESGGAISFGRLDTSADYQNAYNQVSKAVGCDGSLKCLRDTPYERLNSVFNTSQGQSWSPILDGDFIQTLPSLQYASGAFVKVPVITGANTDEGTSAGPIGVNSTQDFVNQIRQRATNDTDLINQLLKAYPDDPCFGIPVDAGCAVFPAPFGAQYRRSAAFFGDYTFLAQRRLQSEIWARNNLSAYSYRFNIRPNGVGWTTGVTHFQEVAFVFDNTPGLGYDAEHGTVNPFAGEPESFYTAAKLMSYSWASFFHDRDPNSFRDKAPQFNQTDLWPRYELDCAENIVFDANVTSHAEKDDFRAEGIRLINEHAADAFHR